MTDADGRDARPTPRSPYLTPATAASTRTPASPASPASPPPPVTEPTAASEPTPASAAESASAPTAASAPEPAGRDESPDVESVFPTAADAPAAPMEPDETDVEPQRVDRNWMGVAAFVAGALLLSIVAIVLGHLGLTAAKRGRANNRSFSVAGLILGYLGLVLTVVGAWLLISPPVTRADVDLQAQQDVSAVGAAAATLATQTGELPDVAQVGTDYRVGDDVFTPHLDSVHGLSIEGSTATDWCLSIGYKGGTQTAYHYLATSGMGAGPCPAGT